MTVPGAFFEVTGAPAEIIKIVDGIQRTGGRLTSDDSASCDLWCEMYDEWFVKHDATIRAEAPALLRRLADARDEYSVPNEADIKRQTDGARQLARYLEDIDQAWGWLPSWKWDEFGVKEPA